MYSCNILKHRDMLYYAMLEKRDKYSIFPCLGVNATLGVHKRTLFPVDNTGDSTLRYANADTRWEQAFPHFTPIVGVAMKTSSAETLWVPCPPTTRSSAETLWVPCPPTTRSSVETLWVPCPPSHQLVWGT